MFKRFGLFFSIALVAMVVLAACGGDDDNGNGGDNGGNGDTGGETVDMEMGEMYFDPESLEADAGASLDVNLANAGSQLHDFTIDDFGGDRVHHEVAAGEEDSFTLDIPDESGDYEFYCSVPGHREAGMEGTLTVN